MVCMMTVMGDRSYIDIDASHGVVGERGLAWKDCLSDMICLCLCLYLWDLGSG